MIKIGDFSKLSLVSVRMLRYYEEMGLLMPSHVDRSSGYRYYSVDQLPRLNRILALKDLGLSLEQIAGLLNGDLPAEQLRGMLKLKQAELDQHIEAEKLRLARVEARLRQIELEAEMSDYEVIIKKVEPQWVASLRKIVPVPQMASQMFETLFVSLEQQGVKPICAPFSIWHDTEYKEKDWDVEVVVAVNQPLAVTQALQAGDVHTVQLPGVERMACTVHTGSFESLPQAYKALIGWIEANGYQMCGGMREIYLRGPGPMPTDPATYVTEIQVPVEKV